jgi:hypothetical protein
MMTGQEKPDDGTLRLGETVKLGYVDQSRDSLSPNKTVHDEISGGEEEITLGKRTVPSRAYVSWFNFKGRDQQRLVASCREASAIASIWPSCCATAATCCCSTSRPTISTSTRCARSKRRYCSLRLCRRHQPRPVVPRPHRDAHAGVRGRKPGGLVRGNYQDYEADRHRRLGLPRISRIGSNTELTR